MLLITNKIYFKLIYTIKKKLQLLFKKFSYGLFKLIYGKIQKSETIGFNNNSSFKLSKINENYCYKVYFVKNARLYTDTINDTAIIQKNKIISGPSFQIRNVKFVNIENNIVFKKGTPRFKKNINGKVFSLLTGGAGNNNYFHWLFDVLPRLKILENTIDLKEIDYFLFPKLSQRFQIESLELLNIPKNKSISAVDFRHIVCDEIIATDHPYVIENDASREIQNLPLWIIDWLKKNFTTKFNLNDTRFPKKIYIERGDADKNIKSLRKIINEKDVIEEVKKRDYTVITLGNYSLTDQIKYIFNAKKIVGLHGAGFGNFVFSSPNSEVLELKPINAGNMYKNLADKCSLSYSCISVVPEKFNENNQMGHIRIDLTELRKKL